MPSSVIWQAPPAEWAARLRGERYYRFYEKVGRVRIVKQAQTVQIRPSTVIVLYMPTVTITRQAAVIADVTADMLGLMDPTPAMKAASEAANTAEALEFWRRPKILDGHVAALRAADLVITSWAEMVDPLMDLTDRPTLHVPDFHGFSGRAFRRGMREAWQILKA